MSETRMFKIHLIFNTDYGKGHKLTVFSGNYNSLLLSFPTRFNKLMDLLFLKRYTSETFFDVYHRINLKKYDNISEVLDVIKILYKDIDICFYPESDLKINEEEFLNYVKEL